jgi:hypothetical protein
LLEGDPSSRRKGVSALRRLTCSLRYAISVLTLLVIATPCALGAAAEPLLREFGEARSHVCKCGMRPGICGCPECTMLEEARRAEHRQTPEPTLMRTCDDDAPALPLSAPLPSTVVAATTTDVISVPTGDRQPIGGGIAFISSADVEPPTPPPRIGTV